MEKVKLNAIIVMEKVVGSAKIAMEQASVPIVMEKDG
jgi:hypothetical protein